MLVLDQQRDMGMMHTVRSRPCVYRLVIYGKKAQGRKHRTRYGQPARSKHLRQNARREREPWLLVASPELPTLSTQQLVTLYHRRMQIESSFRDLKSHRYGQSFEDPATLIWSRYT